MAVVFTAAALVVRSEGIVTAFDFSDPTVWQSPNGVFLATASGLNRVLTSEDFLSWKEVPNRLLDADARTLLLRYGNPNDASGNCGIWAPDVACVSGRWILTVATHAGKARETRIFSLVSDAPEGPFREPRQLVYSREVGILDSIDPEIVVDGSHTYLFFGSLGGIHRLELRADAREPLPGSRPVHVAGNRAGWNYEAMDKTRARQFEGAYLYRRDGWWYLFASAGRFEDESYRLVVGRARKLSDDFTDRTGLLLKEGHATTVLESSPGDRFYGPGHCGEIFAVSGKTLVTYHVHDRRAPVLESYHPRFMAVGRVRWTDDGWPIVEK